MITVKYLVMAFKQQFLWAAADAYLQLNTCSALYPSGRSKGPDSLEFALLIQHTDGSPCFIDRKFSFSFDRMLVKSFKISFMNVNV